MAQTKAVIASLPDKITQATEVLEAEVKTRGDSAAEDELKKAQEVIDAAKKAVEKQG